MRHAVLLLALLAAVPAAVAQPSPSPSPAARERAKKYFDKGQKLYSLGKFDDALVQYEKAYEEVELPELLFNIAQCHRNLKHYDLAIFSFRKYLREKPAADNRPAVEKLVDELEEAKRKEEARRPPQRIPPVPGVTKGPAGGKEPYTPEPPSHVYERWWFWTGLAAVAGVVVAGVIFLPGGGGAPDSDLGNIDFSQ